MAGSESQAQRSQLIPLREVYSLTICFCAPSSLLFMSRRISLSLTVKDGKLRAVFEDLLETRVLLS